MRESRMPGSVGEVPGNRHLYPTEFVSVLSSTGIRLLDSGISFVLRRESCAVCIAGKSIFTKHNAADVRFDPRFNTSGGEDGDFFSRAVKHCAGLCSGSPTLCRPCRAWRSSDF